MAHTQGSWKMYQPSPFGDEVPHVRGDCNDRFKAIFNHEDFAGKRVLDFGCAEGFFGFKAIKHGAAFCEFVDTDEGCLKVIRQRAEQHGYEKKIITSPELIKFNFDVSFCLSLYGEFGVPSLEEFKEMTKVLYISPSGNGDEKNPKLLKHAWDVFMDVKEVHKGYQNRAIYRCS